MISYYTTPVLFLTTFLSKGYIYRFTGNKKLQKCNYERRNSPISAIQNKNTKQRRIQGKIPKVKNQKKKPKKK